MLTSHAVIVLAVNSCLISVFAFCEPLEGKLVLKRGDVSHHTGSDVIILAIIKFLSYVLPLMN